MHWRAIEKSTEIIINKYASGEKKKIMDAGVGMGRLLERFPALERYGMDISRGYLRLAKEKGIEVCMALIEDMPYKNDFFDIVVCTDVLEHVLDLNLAVTKILNTVKEDGILIVRVPYRENLSEYLNPDFPYQLVHLRNFDENNLRLLFEKIFKIKVLEWSLAGHNGGRLKIGAGIPVYSSVMRKVIYGLEKFGGGFGKTIVKGLCHPVVINVVLKK